MRSAVQYIVRWGRGQDAGLDRLSGILKGQYGKRPGAVFTKVDAYVKQGFAAVALVDEPYTDDHVAWTRQVAVITSGAPVTPSGKPVFARMIAEACEQGPQDLLDYLPGISGGFSLVAFFPDLEKLVVVRDRFGLTPVYYSFKDGGPVAVGTGPLTAARAMGVVEPNQKFIARYMVFRYDEIFGHEETFLKDTWFVPPATAVEIGGEIARRRYWSFAELDRTVWTDESLLEEACLNHLLSSTRQAVYNDVTQADLEKSIIALSSGLDSSSVAGACKKLGQPLAAFTARYDVPSPVNEFEPAQRIAEGVCREWKPVVISPDDFLASWKNAYSIHEYPLATSACLGYDVLLKKVAALGYRRIVTGGSSDDLFAGNYPCYLYNLADLFAGHSPRFEREFHAWVKLHGTAEFPKDLMVLWDFLTSHVDLSERGTVTPKPRLLSRDLVRVDCLGDALHSAPTIRMNAGGYLHSYAAYGFWFAAKQPGLLPIAEGVWHFGPEMLDPFTNESFLKFAWKLPSHWKIQDGYNKVILRKIMKDLLPTEIVGRVTKVGFDVPFQTWSALPGYREFISDLLQSPQARQVDSVVDIQAVRRIVSGEVSRPILPMLVWQIANAILWLKMIRP